MDLSEKLICDLDNSTSFGDLVEHRLKREQNPQDGIVTYCEPEIQANYTISVDFQFNFNEINAKLDDLIENTNARKIDIVRYQNFKTILRYLQLNNRNYAVTVRNIGIVYETIDGEVLSMLLINPSIIKYTNHLNDLIVKYNARVFTKPSVIQPTEKYTSSSIEKYTTLAPATEKYTQVTPNCSDNTSVVFTIPSIFQFELKFRLRNCMYYVRQREGAVISKKRLLLSLIDFTLFNSLLYFSSFDSWVIIKSQVQQQPLRTVYDICTSNIFRLPILAYTLIHPISSLIVGLSMLLNLQQSFKICRALKSV